MGLMVLHPHARRRRPLPSKTRLKSRLPRITLGHLLIAIAVAAPPMAIVARMAPDQDVANGLFTGVVALAAAFEVELAFWLIFGGRIQRYLAPPAPPRPGEIRWLDETGKDPKGPT
jgi:hypothetical protein